MNIFHLLTKNNLMNNMIRYKKNKMNKNKQFIYQL